MTGSPNDVGTHTWVERTGGLLTGAERRGRAFVAAAGGADRALDGEHEEGQGDERLREHDGAYAYTVGQRKGLGIDRPAPDGRPRYVLDVQPASNRVVVGPAELLSVDRVEAGAAVWFDDARPAAGEQADVEVQVRAHGAPVAARVRAGDVVIR